MSLDNALLSDSYPGTSATQNRAEAKLVRALQAQQEYALSALYEAYSPALYGVILRIVKIEATAEDVLQDCFLKIWYSFAQYDPAKSKLYTWLLHIARHLAIDKIRSRSHRDGLKTRNLEASSFLAPLLYSGFKPEYIGLRKIVEQLPAPHQTIIDLMYFEGYTQSEISLELAIPLGTVKTRARQALKCLRKLI